VRSNPSSLLVLSIVALACAGTLLGQARNKSLPGRMDEYGRTLNALARYRVLATEDDGEMLPAPEEFVEPGDQYEGVPRLVRLLRLLGDLPADAVTGDSDGNNTDVYEGDLVAAVEQFQSRHGLKPDGKIGEETLAQLNTPLAFRIHQLELALERWRRRPYDPSRPAIVLNVPEFKLRAFSPGGHQDLEMKIIVGQAKDRRTPLLASRLESVIFRPYWNIPMSIQRNELLPEIVKDAKFLPDNHIEVLTPQGAVVDNTVSEDLLAQLRSGKLRLRQTPGPKNALGLVKFVFPNEYEVYMHSTPARWLFDPPRRDFSHGCVRLEKAEDLAEWVLRGENGWPRDRVVGAMEGAESTSVRLKQPIQVVTMYVTAVALENGEVHFFEDIYGEDAALERELATLAASRAQRAATSGEPGRRRRE
jgi:murein L,D-transpeptidase YcbB/YkuD